MTEQFLDRADIRAIFQHVGRETVAQGMRNGRLEDTGPGKGRFELLAKRRFMQMMASYPAAARITAPASGREDILPA